MELWYFGILKGQTEKIFIPGVIGGKIARVVRLM